MSLLKYNTNRSDIINLKNNINCARAIDNAINENFNDNRLKRDVVISSLADNYNFHQITHVLAAQVYNHSWDGRYDKNVVTWANEQMKSFSEELITRSKEYYLTSHPILINGLTNRIIELQKSIENATKFEYNFPDKNITLDDMENFGYQYSEKNEMLPLGVEKAKELFNSDVSIYRLYEDNSEGLVQEASELDEHKGLFGIERADWEEFLNQLEEEPEIEI